MAPSYKLTYFDGQGIAEPIRLILAYAKVQFEDERLDGKDWPARKPQMPWGQVPVLEEDGKQLSQSLTIIRYLGNKFGLAPPTEWEVAKANEYIDALVDVRTAVYTAQYTRPKPNEAKLQEIAEQQLPTTWGRFNAILKKNGSGYLVGDKISYADIFVAHVIQALADTLKVADKLRGGEYPEVTGHIERVMGQPGIKEWVENRKPTAF